MQLSVGLIHAIKVVISHCTSSQNKTVAVQYLSPSATCTWWEKNLLDWSKLSHFEGRCKKAWSSMHFPSTNLTVDASWRPDPCILYGDNLFVLFVNCELKLSNNYALILQNWLIGIHRVERRHASSGSLFQYVQRAWMYFTPVMVLSKPSDVSHTLPLQTRTNGLHVIGSDCHGRSWQWAGRKIWCTQSSPISHSIGYNYQWHSFSTPHWYQGRTLLLQAVEISQNNLLL